MDINAIKQLLAEDLSAIDQLIAGHLNSDINLIKSLSKHIVDSGGKRLRPMLTLLSAHCFDYQGKQHRDLAALIEFIHTATLLHDDVVDSSELRRGSQTANAIWGNEASVLVGDFLFSRSFQMMVAIENFQILTVLSNATNAITEGEVIQLMNRHNANPSEEDYLSVIHAKTAILFGAATQVGAIISEQPQAIEQAMLDYGTHLGMAFQLIDDALDFQGNAEQMGKNVGDDLAEGKATLPLIYALNQSSKSERKLIENAITQGDLTHLEDIQTTIQTSGAIDYTHNAANTQIDKAITALQNIGDSVYKDALLSLTNFALTRNH